MSYKLDRVGRTRNRVWILPPGGYTLLGNMGTRLPSRPRFYALPQGFLRVALRDPKTRISGSEPGGAVLSVESEGCAASGTMPVYDE